MTDENLEDRVRRIENGIRDIPSFRLAPVDHDYRVLPIQRPLASSSSIASRLTKVVITWISVDDPQVDHYEIWITRIANGADKPYLAASVKDSPATFNIVSTAAGHALAYIVTVMKNGVKTPLTAAPSATFQVF